MYEFEAESNTNILLKLILKLLMKLPFHRWSLYLRMKMR
jgi:hypothetical protein